LDALNIQKDHLRATGSCCLKNPHYSAVIDVEEMASCSMA
jgi:hypothetical protein